MQLYANTIQIIHCLLGTVLIVVYTEFRGMEIAFLGFAIRFLWLKKKMLVKYSFSLFKFIEKRISRDSVIRIETTSLTTWKDQTFTLFSNLVEHHLNKVNYLQK